MSDEIPTPEWISVLVGDLGRLVENYWRGVDDADAPERGSPAHNSGAVFEDGVFAIRSYYWNCEGCDDPSCRCQKPNFECGDFRVRWYKHCRRGATQNRPVSAEEFVSIYERCVARIRQLEKEAEAAELERGP